MTVSIAKHDRARASEHAIVLLRTVPFSAEDIARRLPLTLDALGTKLALRPSAGSATPMPLEIAFKCLPAESRWLVRLRCPSTGATTDFFDGEIRLDNISRTETELTLIGRFALPDELVRAEPGEDTARHIAEENVAALFDTVLQGLYREL